MLMYVSFHASVCICDAVGVHVNILLMCKWYVNMNNTYVTGPAKTGHVGTNYTWSLKDSYLSTVTEYFHSVTCIILPNKFIQNAENFIAIACWDKKL